MTDQDLTISAIIGGVFIVLGFLAFLWSRREESDWYSHASRKIDVREYLDHNPIHHEHTALRTGGKIFMAVGLVVLLLALGFLIFG